MLKRLALCVVAFIIVTACNTLSGPEKPEDLISKEEMIDIIIDAKLIGSASNANKKIMKEHGLDINAYVFKKYSIDSLQFALSNEYYTYYIKEYEEIYTAIKDSLDTLKAKFKALELKEEKEKKVKDSLNVLIRKKDSISHLTKFKDSLKLIIEKDSLNKDILLLKEIEEGGLLIKSVSDIIAQPE